MAEVRERMHVIYASDDSYAMKMGISMISLFRSNPEGVEIAVHILDSQISPENRARIEEICAKHRQPGPDWIPARDICRELNIEVTLDRGSVSQYSRLFIGSALPEEIERALYLDCDTLILRPLEELWHMDLRGKTLAALSDAFSRFYRANLGLAPEDHMLNSGVMLIDLRRWRSQAVEDRLIEFIVRKKGRVQQGDQGVLNAVLSRDTLYFAPRFNAVTCFFDLNYEDMLRMRKPPSCYSKQELDEALRAPVIVHFTSSFLSKRPWMRGCGHVYAAEWLRYKAESPWANQALGEDDRPCWKQFLISIYARLPSKLAVPIAGILHAYVRPLIVWRWHFFGA